MSRSRVMYSSPYGEMGRSTVRNVTGRRNEERRIESEAKSVSIIFPSSSLSQMYNSEQ